MFLVLFVWLSDCKDKDCAKPTKLIFMKTWWQDVTWAKEEPITFLDWI